MKKHFPHIAMAVLALSVLLLAVAAVARQDTPWKKHDWNRPRPSVLDPGTPSTQEVPGRAPSDAAVLFDGKDLSQWCSMDGSPSKWVVKDNVMECTPGSGPIRTLQNFGDCQLHVEWASPVPPQGRSQGRGNSGVFLMGIYEIQVLDSYQNETYADGQAASIYGQFPPLVNASLPPGRWQSYDVIFARPRFDEKGEVVSPARITLLHNGVLVQNNTAIAGPTQWMTRGPYRGHADKLPLSLQDHGNPVRYRNIWIRELTDAAQKEFTYSQEVLDRLTGTYRVDNRLSIVVLRKGNQLFLNVVELGRQHEHALYAESRTKFFAKDVDCSLSFQTNDQGIAESVEYYMAGDTRRVKKTQ